MWRDETTEESRSGPRRHAEDIRRRAQGDARVPQMRQNRLRSRAQRCLPSPSTPPKELAELGDFYLHNSVAVRLLSAGSHRHAKHQNRPPRLPDRLPRLPRPRRPALHNQTGRENARHPFPAHRRPPHRNPRRLQSPLRTADVKLPDCIVLGIGESHSTVRYCRDSRRTE